MDWDTLNGFICAQENQGIFSSGISLEDTFPELSPSSQEPHPVSFSLVQSISHGSHGCKGFQHLSYDLGARYLGKKLPKRRIPRALHHPLLPSQAEIAPFLSSDKDKGIPIKIL